MSTLKVNTIKNADNVEVYTVKAWVNFNGTGTVAIRAAGNVSSITDNGTGDYTVNFTNAMPDANYAVIGFTGNTGSQIDSKRSWTLNENSAAPTTTAVRVNAANSATGGMVDSTYCHVAIFR